jgi:uncharacterized protein YjaZ
MVLPTSTAGSRTGVSIFVQFQIVDTETIYRRLLAAPGAAGREAIFQELIAPFTGLVQVFGGDGLAAFASWGMSPQQFAGENCERMAAILDTLAAHDAWSQAAQALEEGGAAFARYGDRIPLDTIVFGLMMADMSGVPLQRGYTGFGGIPGWIMTVYGDPDEYNLARIKAATVHELHHNIRGVVVPSSFLTISVGEYMILEGLAESFAAELYGQDKIGFWVTDFDESRLEEARQVIGRALDVTGFGQIRGYIFGDLLAGHMGLPQAGVPDFAGYAIGYRVVQAYLQHTGQNVAEATFVPAQRIITESRFFGQ